MTSESWNRYRRLLCRFAPLGITVDFSRMHFDDAFLTVMAEPMARAMDAMSKLEGGAIANASEGRMVGHYWLRAPDLSPSESIARKIRQSIERIRVFARGVHDGSIRPLQADGFYAALLIGIGGSALGVQFASEALSRDDDQVLLRFLDNSDPDGIRRVLTELKDMLSETLVIVTSKSGGTVETRNAMMVVQRAFQEQGLLFARQAVAVTCDGSELDRKAKSEDWLDVFPMWDWVGGRTSLFSAAGLLPLALQGVDINELLEGARLCDVGTREKEILRNPAACIALMWYAAGGGQGRRAMVVIPYRDRLVLLGRYLQQLVMESLGKSHDRSGALVHQGLTVLGNKGSTDQHAFVQQLRDGSDDFFATFVQVLADETPEIGVADPTTVEVEPGADSGDCLFGLLMGTREALSEKGRQSLLIEMENGSPRTFGGLIALFERTVGLYAELINVNAYDQPGVEAGKRAASQTLTLRKKALDAMRTRRGEEWIAQQWADAVGESDQVESILHILEREAVKTPKSIQRFPHEDAAQIRYVWR